MSVDIYIYIYVASVVRVKTKYDPNSDTIKD